MLSQTQAVRYSNDLLALDDDILAVAVVDTQGKLINLDWKKGRVPWRESGDAEFEKVQIMLGSWMKIILGLSEQTAPLIGSLEVAAFVHKKFQLILLGSPSKQCNIGVMVSRAANVDYIVKKIEDILGSTQSV